MCIIFYLNVLLISLAIKNVQKRRNFTFYSPQMISDYIMFRTFYGLPNHQLSERHKIL